MDEIDDEPLRTTREERQIWAGLVNVVVSSAVYFAYLAPEVRRTPIGEISWIGPMAWSMVAGIAGTIVTAIVLEIVVGVRRRSELGEVAVDVRDREIGRRGGRFSTPILATGMTLVLILASADADGFWIGNLVFLCGLLTAVVEAAAKLRYYRRGF
ncbi:energy-converting hydrogenase Eha subunit A [Actinoplanes octamycinicus]|uniref:Energy-converting hydrogenase Eha subunit A n=1 Tax=Actinoplanes octamycinicus TaxID=135948 RepID=A0A7W7GZK6_9ACTN|nr:hypothetical protein [Actinoplanes octamycinicus]MBB4741022.1 energy-converting hydrogenase Eha subunit A [Actinoplanes octamycinicus]GIE55927.1 hypothetical protein Aoc01nite_13290 [Actinoplanes octamycinicus]